jgi:hypothetical protein
MNKFEKSLERIKKNVKIQDSWTEEDFEHYKTINEALEFCAKLHGAKPNEQKIIP